MNALWHIEVDGVRRWARGAVVDGPQELLAADVELAVLLAKGGRSFTELDDLPVVGEVPAGSRLLAPIDRQEVWAAGVTYERSRAARMEEAHMPDHYDRVYLAERPELFFKATAERVRGPGEPVGIRVDSGWDVPEPELGVVVDAHGRVAAFVLGNDMSSRSIEGDNPLYLPQAKIFTGSCAIGPCLVPPEAALPLSALQITMTVGRHGHVVYEDGMDLADLRHTPEGLANWLTRALEFPLGVVLLTGTGIVPPSDFTLRAGDEITISVPEFGSLSNMVELVGNADSAITTP